MIIGVCGKIGSGKNTVGKMIQSLTEVDYKDDITLDMIKSSEENGRDYLDIHSDWKIKSFAYKIKQILSILTGCTMEQLKDRKFKESKLPKEWNMWVVTIGKEPHIYFRKTVKSIEEAEDIMFEYNRLHYDITYYEWLPTYREALRYIGTDMFIDFFHPLTWINALFAKYKPLAKYSYYGKAKVYDLTSLKYPNWIITDVRFINEAKAIKERDGIIIKLTRNINKEDSHPSEKNVPDIKEDYLIDNKNYSLKETLNKVREILLTENIISKRAA